MSTNETIETMNQKDHSLSDPKIEAVQKLYAAVAQNDLDAILAELADNVDWSAEAASNSVPWYGSYHGKSGVGRFFQAIGTSIQITEFTPLAFASNETDVMVPVRWSYTVNASGKGVSMTMHHWYRFANGKIVFFRGAEDSEQSAAAFS